jgi:thiol-disulfide isomerase/thioredoxin
LMILTALAIASSFDVAFQQWVLKYFPSVNIEDNAIVRQEIGKLREDSASLGELSPAPEFKGIEAWLNSEPLTLEKLKGKVVLVDFWTYSCINCVRTLPYITKWYDKYKDQGLVVVGVHTPEFEFEKNKNNVAEAIKRFNIHYPVPLDNNYGTWLAYHNMYWPAHYLIDQKGIIRSIHYGEGAYVETENEIRQLLGLSPISESEPSGSFRPLTPETYLGYKRASSYTLLNDIQDNITYNYTYNQPLRLNQVGLKGKWKVGPESIESVGDSELSLNFLAGHVYLVMSGDSSQPLRFDLDGLPLPEEYYGKDLDSKGLLPVKEARMYELFSGKYGRHTLTIHFPPGVSAYAFTFGDGS